MWFCRAFSDCSGHDAEWFALIGGRTAPVVPGRTLPLLPQPSAWHYIDPEGKEQGPFDVKKLLNWVDLGYFGQSDLQVQRHGMLHGMFIVLVLQVSTP